MGNHLPVLSAGAIILNSGNDVTMKAHMGGMGTTATDGCSSNNTHAFKKRRQILTLHPAAIQSMGRQRGQWSVQV